MVTKMQNICKIDVRCCCIKKKNNIYFVVRVMSNSQSVHKMTVEKKKGVRPLKTMKVL